jgi:hypothetical protein
MKDDDQNESNDLADEIELTEEEEAALDRAWEKLDQESKA